MGAVHVLVTGAAGFIGSHLVDRLLAEGHRVTAVDDLSTGDMRNLDAARRSPRFAFHRMDVADPGLAAVTAAAAPEVICHLAAQVSVRVSVADPVTDTRTNVLGTVNVLEAARRAQARKVVFTSSVAVYGVPAMLPVPPDAPLAPRSPYGAAKASGEIYLGVYRVLHGLDYTTLTLANVYGPRQTPTGEAGVIAIFSDALLRGRPTRVYGDGSQTRDYVFVDDVVDAFTRACEERAGGRRVDIGTGAQTSDRELHRLVAAAVGARDDPAYAPSRLGDLPAMAVDPRPAHEALGWAPRTELAQGIKLTVDWMRAHLT